MAPWRATFPKALKWGNMLEKLSFKGEPVLITGGGAGIAKASALLFAQEGARIIIASAAAGLRNAVRKPASGRPASRRSRPSARCRA